MSKLYDAIRRTQEARRLQEEPIQLSAVREFIDTYTPDMTRPSCPDCGAPVIETTTTPEIPWPGTCGNGHTRTYQLEA